MLTFGSAEEQRVYRSLKRLQASFPEAQTIAIAPLPGVRLRAGHTWSPDILVIGRGRALIVETDGPHHRSQRRYVDDRNRDLQWQRCGIPAARIAVEDLKDDDALDGRLREEVVRHLRRDG
jgi:very-short-patch-repair endonuclease